jgi:tripartite-type tricarboxylate transporter receptor subunit TctC
MKFIFILLLLISTNSWSVNKVIVASTAGGSVDLLSRQFVKFAEIDTGKEFIVENNGGAGGVLAATQLIQSKPNTIMITSSTWYITLSENKFQLKDFKPVAVLAESPMYLMVHKSQKLTCEKLKASGINYFIGSGSRGQTSVVANFLTKEFKYITEIPYKGVKQSVLDLLGNQIHGTIIASTTDLQEPLMLLANSSKYTVNGIPSFKDCFGIEKTALGQFIIIASPNTDERFIIDLNNVAKRFVDDVNIKKYYNENGLNSKVTDYKKTLTIIDSELNNWNNILK